MPKISKKIPKTINKLFLDNKSYSFGANRINYKFSKISRSALRMISNTLISVFIENLTLSGRDLQNIIQRGKHLDKITFEDCIIETDSFSLKQNISYEIKIIDFGH